MVLDFSPIMMAALRQEPAAISLFRVGAPAQDVTHRWVDDVLNAHTVTAGASAASNDTAITLSTGHGARCREGTILMHRLRNAALAESMQVTATAADAVTVTRAYNGATAVSIANAAVLDITSNPLQEGSAAQKDVSTARTARSNPTEIFERTIALTRNQDLRKMVAVPSEWTHQAAQRSFEISREMAKSFIYGAANSTTAAGSDTQYRTFDGLDAWLRISGSNNTTTAATFSAANLNTDVFNIWSAGGQADTLILSGNLQQTLSAFESASIQRMESSTRRGFFVNYFISDLGVPLRAVVDPYVMYGSGRGDYYVVDSNRISLHPFIGSAYIMKSAPTNDDARIARLISEWTVEVRNSADGAHARRTNVAA